MTRALTFRELEQLLGQLGFQMEAAENGRKVFVHRKSQTVFPFRPYGPNELVADINIVMVRRNLDERGLLEAEEFNSFMSKTPA